MKQAINEMYSALSAPLPTEAFSRNGKFTSINDAYVKERLNEVLGPEGWHLKPKPVINSCELWCDAEGKRLRDSDGAPYWEATATVAVYIPAFKKTYYGEGGFRSTDRGNARKGAITDAFGKALSDLIGIEVYKGQVNAFDIQAPEQRKAYVFGFQCGFSASKTGMTLDEAIEADNYQRVNGDGR